MNFLEFARNFSIADCFEEVAENDVRVHVHIGAVFAAMLLQRVKFLNRVLLSLEVFDTRFGGSDISTCLLCDLIPDYQFHRPLAWPSDFEQTLLTTVLLSSAWRLKVRDRRAELQDRQRGSWRGHCERCDPFP